MKRNFGLGLMIITIGLIIYSAANILPKSYQDYSKLKAYLKAKNLKAADVKTTRLILAISGRFWKKEFNFLEYDEVFPSLPYNKLLALDKLWLNSSNNRFGLSVQVQAWRKTAKDLKTEYSHDFEVFKALEQKLGWGNSYSNYSAAPNGYFPTNKWIYPSTPQGSVWMDTAAELYEKLEACQKASNSS